MERYALLLGWQYNNGNYSELECVKRDIEGFKNVLEKYGDFKKNNIVIALDEGLQETREKIEKFFNRLKRSDFVLFYYSGHGEINTETNKLYFIANDTKLDVLKSTSIDKDFIFDCLAEKNPMGSVFIIDCCYSGGFAKGAFKKSADRHLVKVSKGDIENCLKGREKENGRGCYITGTEEEKNQRYKEYIAKDMAEIQEGTFMMGSPENEPDRNDDEKQHKVRLDGFSISKYPVTVKIFGEFLSGSRGRYTIENDKNRGSYIWDGENWEEKKGIDWQCNVKGEKHDNLDHPAIHVNWYEAQMFCKLLGCTLPTEAQLEYACRAGKEMSFNTGDVLTAERANYGLNIGETTPGGSYPPNLPNNSGLYDMHGNVLEWCCDWYSDSYYDECEQQGIVENPTGAAEGVRRVLRGGSWNYNAWSCRSAYRYCLTPGHRSNFVGFRPVLLRS